MVLRKLPFLLSFEWIGCAPVYTQGDDFLFACALRHFQLMLTSSQFFFFGRNKSDSFWSFSERLNYFDSGILFFVLLESRCFYATVLCQHFFQDLAVLEQVSYHTFKTTNILCMFWMLALPPNSKAFGNNPLDSDHQDEVHSDRKWAREVRQRA